MVSNLINTREDLDACAGTPAHDEAMAMLRGTLWRLERDDAAKTWRTVADDSIIARFGLLRADFPNAVPPALPEYQAPDIAALIVAATQARLDAFAQARNYDGILSAATYAASAVPKFAAEGQYAITVRDQTWAALYTLMGAVQAGTHPMPSGFADVEPLLPALAWPV